VENVASAALGDLAPLSSLADPTRRRLYAFVAAAGRSVGRDEAAAAVGISRSLAAYHLDRLAGEGLLVVAYGRPPGRGGPGAGRPAKLYRRSAREFAVRAPPRDYHLLAELLVRAADGDTSGAAQEAIERAAFEVGECLGAAAESLEEVLLERGYEPIAADAGLLRLCNCPFGRLAARVPDVVCRLNLALLRGVLSGVGSDPALASLAPREGECCVVIHASASG
jgi:predicted ArsR family transcriptional regulator